MRGHFGLIASALLLCPLLAFSQSTGSASIVYADGFGFEILRSGVAERYDVYADDVYSLEIDPGDRISTDDETYLEVQLRDSRTVIKVFENTTVTITASDSEATSLGVSYGRVRAIVRSLGGEEQFHMRTRTAVAAVRGTDFAVESVLTRSGEIEDSVYCLEGSVEVGTLAPEAIERLDAALAAGSPADAALTAERGQLVVWEQDVVETVVLQPWQQASIEVRNRTSDSGSGSDAVDEANVTSRPLLAAVDMGETERSRWNADQVRTEVIEAPLGSARIDGPAEQTGEQPGEETEIEVAAIATPETNDARATPIPIDEPTPLFGGEPRPRGPIALDALAGGGAYGVAGIRYGFARGLMSFAVLGGVTNAQGLAGAGLLRLTVEPLNWRISPSASIVALAVSDLESLTLSAALSAGVALRFDRIIRSIYVENLFYVNTIPWSPFPIVYRPAVGITL